MISISRHIDEYDIAEEVRLERCVHKGSFLLVEGDTDIKRFGKFIDSERCSFVNCHGKQKLIGAIKIIYDRGFSGVLGLADADFDRINNCLCEHEGVIYSSTHDFDLDWAAPAAIKTYLTAVSYTHLTLPTKA